MELERCGNRKAAQALYRKAVDVTPAMARAIIDAVIDTYGDGDGDGDGRVRYVVAPYEADAQLAWLSHHNLVHAIISEDSDLLPFGCERVLFKMDNQGVGMCLHHFSSRVLIPSPTTITMSSHLRHQKPNTEILKLIANINIRFCR